MSRHASRDAPRSAASPFLQSHSFLPIFMGSRPLPCHLPAPGWCPVGLPDYSCEPWRAHAR